MMDLIIRIFLERILWFRDEIIANPVLQKEIYWPFQVSSNSWVLFQDVSGHFLNISKPLFAINTTCWVIFVFWEQSSLRCRQPYCFQYQKFHQTHSNRRINGLLIDWFFPADLCDQEHSNFNSLCHLERAWSVFCRHIRTLCLPGTASLAGGFRLSHDHLRGHSGEYIQPSPWLKDISLPGNSNGCLWRIPWNWWAYPNSGIMGMNAN